MEERDTKAMDGRGERLAEEEKEGETLVVGLWELEEE